MRTMDKKKIYISLPLGGHEKSARARYELAVMEVKSMFADEDLEICGPINIKDFKVDEGLSAPREHDWAWYMGEDMKELLRSTHIYLTQGWAWSPGCRIERAAAIAHNMVVLESEDSEKKLDD